MLRSTLTVRWQTTIPAEVRKALNLKPRQKIIYELTGDGVLIKPQTDILPDLYGSLSSEVPAGTKEEERKSACRSRVKRYSK